MDYPDKFLELSIYVTVEACTDAKLGFDSENYVQEVVIGREEAIEFSAPILESRAACGGAVTASYKFEPLSLPEGSTLGDFIVY